MELLEYAAEKLNCYLSDFHYKRNVMAAEELLFHVLDEYPLEEWVHAYQYIFYDDHQPSGTTPMDVYDEIYHRLLKEGTPLDPEN